MIDELAARVFCARDAAHRAHWRTGSYAAHVALGEFYAAVVAAIDEIVETYQGQFGLVDAFEVHCDAVASMPAYLTQEADWIAANRDAIAQGSAAVANLIDGLVAHYRTAVYKLTYLV